MGKIPPFPFPEGILEAYRIDAHRRPTTGQLGGHIVRRLGDSLEFSEFIYYQPGMDIRHVDWRASNRPSWRGTINTSDGWLVRRFNAEDRLKIVISLDTRETMDYPSTMAKRTIACWLAEALSFVALRSGDEVIFHRLFGQRGFISPSLRGAGDAGNRRRALLRVSDAVNDGADINLEPLDKNLPPAAVWIIISDLYMSAERADELSKRVAAARNGRRWIILVELDSWPYERAILTHRLWRIMGPGSEPKLVQITLNDDGPILDAENRIKEHTTKVAGSMKGSLFNHVRWQWPASNDTKIEPFFHEMFFNDEVLKHLFRSVPWR